MPNLELIQQKCAEANPDGFEFGVSRPIRLADVLLAIRANPSHHSYSIQVSENVSFCRGETWIEIGWNLRKDNLNDQSEDTIHALADLLK